jgi:hypothetical protein
MTTQTIEHQNFCRNVKQYQHWLRLIYMLILGVLLNLAGVVMWVLCGLQFLFVLGTGSDNRQLRAMAHSIARFIEQALLYVSYNSDHKPFPFAPWSEAKDSSGDTSSSNLAAAMADDQSPDKSDPTP